MRNFANKTSLAAIEIEMWMNGRKRRGFYHTEELAREFEDFSRERPDWLNSMAGMYSWLIWPGFEDLKGKTKEDLYLQMNLFSKDLRNLTGIREEQQAILLDSCITLTKLALANGNPFGSYRMRLAA